jgi:ABC-type Fe3+ transport system substrate-binding protein
MLGNQAAVIKGAPNPNAGKLLVEFMLSKEGADILVEGEAFYVFMKDYKPPESVKPYLVDLSGQKLLGLKDWAGAQAEFKGVRDAWQAVFR